MQSTNKPIAGGAKPGVRAQRKAEAETAKRRATSAGACVSAMHGCCMFDGGNKTRTHGQTQAQNTWRA